MITSPTCIPGSGRDVAGRARGPQRPAEGAQMATTAIPTRVIVSRCFDGVEGVLSAGVLDADRTVVMADLGQPWSQIVAAADGQAWFWTCTCLAASGEFEDRAGCEADRDLHDAGHDPAVTS